jgi:hypothetical protein
VLDDAAGDGVVGVVGAGVAGVVVGVGVVLTVVVVGAVGLAVDAVELPHPIMAAVMAAMAAAVNVWCLIWPPAVSDDTRVKPLFRAHTRFVKQW